MKSFYHSYQSPLRQNQSTSGNPDISQVDANERTTDAQKTESIEELKKLATKSAGLKKQSAVLQLCDIGNQDAFDALLTMLASEDVPLRNLVIELLAEHPLLCEAHLDRLTQHPNCDVRIFAMNILSQVTHDDVEYWILKALDQERDVNVCAAALEALDAIATQNSEQAIRDIKARFAEHEFIQFSADDLLDKIMER